jgi:integration host factor subunit alpha
MERPDSASGRIDRLNDMNDRHANLMTAAAFGEEGDRQASARDDDTPDSRITEVPTLTKAELAEMLFDQVGLNKRESKDMVEAFFDVIREALERGESVKLSGFGNFQLRDKPQRPGRNPKTGEVIPITARRVATFHASQKLKSLVEERAGLVSG